MTAVAEHSISAVFAATEIDGPILLSRVRGRCEIRPFVRAVAKRLRTTLTARAPIVGFAGFNSDWDWGFLGDDRFGHGSEKWLVNI
jgi:hypothetical protein